MPVEIKDETLLFEPISDDNISIAILVDKKNTFVANHIARYLMKVGIGVDSIKAVTNLNKITKNTTHLIAFENKVNSDILSYVKKEKLELLVIEENFLSLKSEDIDDAMLVSQYNFFGESIYSFLNSNVAPRVLIVEDDKISNVLLTTMLEEEYCTIDSAQDGKEGLKLLVKALKAKIPYDIVYTDHNMPLLSGSEMLRQYIDLEEKSLGKKSITTVSISGDVANKDELFDFDFFATKPFKKREIHSIFFNSINKGAIDAKT
jgi:CheY-like chemotaxis protein